ncbi:MAG: hypothetical protein M1840_000636 [Geoglossum simile]|nr:MAG: hypothetical protein M1840_000636 [Geoglossum simile]
MSYQTTLQDTPPYTNQADFGLPQPEFNYAETFPCSGCYDLLLYLLSDQTPISTVCTSCGTVSLPPENSEWLEGDVALDYPVTATEGQLPQLQPAIEEQSTGPEYSRDSQDLRQVIMRLETKCDRLEEVIKKLENKLEEKMKFVAGVEDYINKLVPWTVEFNRAAENLAEDIVEIKEVINLSKS